MKLSIPILVLSCGGLAYASLGIHSIPVASPDINFGRDIKLILSQHCFKCHGPDATKAAAGLRLDSAEGATKFLGDGRAIVPNHADKSLLISRVSETDLQLRMPPPNAGVTPLTKEQIALMRIWINQGARYAKHWSFVPPVAPKVPQVSQPAWCRNPIDTFVLKKLDEVGLRPEPEADRNTLALRAAETLTGLPPTESEFYRYLGDRLPGSYERYVDRLLSSPAYGEQQARFWLDSVRYADSHGLQLDNERAVYPYRDWVVSAFNQDLPFNKFIEWQLAGDLLPNPSQSQLVATGYVRMNLTSNEGGAIAEEFLARNTFDRVDTTSTVLLGLTVGCARCHDHKFDPIKQKDYYGLYAYFDSTADDPLDGNISLPPPFLSLGTPAQTAKLAELNSQIEIIKASKSPADVEAFKRLMKERDDLDSTIPKTLIAREMPSPRPTFILKRGLYDQKGDAVDRHIPGVLGNLPNGVPNNRLGLAKWMTSPQNPLVARVFVNRVWQQVFGVGLVKTSEDFGSQGEWPMNQPLLDYLATAFVAKGWSIKALNRMIVTSAAFRQSSHVSAQKLAKDSENRLVSRGPRFRLDAEQIRDKALDSAGLLVTKLEGHGFKPYQPDGLWEGSSDPASSLHVYTRDHNLDIYRRSMYQFWKRTSPPPVMVTFDAPARDTCTVRRSTTNTPLQALTTLNETAFLEASRVMAQRLLATKSSDANRLQTAFKLALCRNPQPWELSVLSKALQRYRRRYQAEPNQAKELLKVGDWPELATVPTSESAAWMIVCSTLMNTDEFLTQH